MIVTREGLRKRIRRDASADVREPAGPPRGRGRALLARLLEPVDNASIVAFRVAFGAIMIWEVSRYFRFGWIPEYFIDPTFHFTFFGFHWVQPWPGELMYAHFAVLGVLAFFVMVGLFYRVAAALFAVGFTYVFLLEQARYLNHFYFVCLIAALLIVIPAHRAWSLDAWLRPSLRSRTAPAWALWALRAQIGLVFLYAGVAKLNGDWLRGEPLRMWLAERTDFFVIGRLFTEEPVVYLMSYSGLAIDLLVVPFLLWRRTRPFAFLAALSFHLMNSQLFSIGIFPWFSIAAALLFFSPGWPRFRGLRAHLGRENAPESEPPTVATRRRPGRTEAVVLGGLAVFFLVQVLAPPRHLVYPGNVSWTEEGHQFAWHMKLRDKEADARFFAVDGSTGESRELDPRSELTSWQHSKMSARPDMILQYAHHLKGQLRKAGLGDFQIHAYAVASLNGRRPQLLVDPDVDLASIQRNPLRHASWIVPLREPLP